MNKEQKMKKITGLFVAMLLLLSSCGSVPLTGRKQVLLVSDQEVLSSSLTQYSDYMKSAKKSSSKDGAAMVTRVGKKIAAATEQYLKNNGLESEIKNFAWEFNLVNDSQVNAFCMPGGKIVVYEGLMQLVSSDDELAVVVGHEVAHAVAKHSNERMSQQLMAQYGAQILGQALSNKSAAVQQIGNSCLAVWVLNMVLCCHSPANTNLRLIIWGWSLWQWLVITPKSPSISGKKCLPANPVLPPNL